MFRRTSYLSSILPRITVHLHSYIQVKQGCTFAAVKQSFVELIALDDECENIAANAIVFVEFPGTSSQRLVDDAQKIRQMKGHLLYAYEVHPDVAARAAAEDAAATAAIATAAAESEGVASETHSASRSTGRSDGDVTPSVTPAQSAPSTPRRGDVGGSDSAPPSNRSSPEPGARAARKAQDAADDARKFAIPGHIFAVHRKLETVATHFLTLPNRHQIFGSPILVPVDKECTNASLYVVSPLFSEHSGSV